MSESVQKAEKKSGNIFSRMWLFVRQIIAELRKVVRPSREELWTYFAVVLLFVLAVMVFVGVLDFLYGQLAMLTFGG
ncbi:preprotein translocase subunit SecE [Ruaniaceae bacterium KH17]|nr:preprotein translocase subunit SecE [Ruaniaceae bacterium KH17]